MQPMVNIALRAARQAGDLIARALEKAPDLQIQQKGVNDFVSEIDRAAERTILSALQKHYPNHGFLCEEAGEIQGQDDGKDTLWIIDPLDGTTNFLHGIPHFAISIAVRHKGQLEHAVVLDPIRREEFTASRGRGAHLNGRRIRVSKRTTLDQALIGTGFPFRPDQFPHLETYLDVLRHLARTTAGLRRAGAATLDLAYVAAGRFDGFWEEGLQPWDLAAGMLLVREAGGLVGDFQGGSQCMETGQIVCGPPKIFKELLITLDKASKGTLDKPS